MPGLAYDAVNASVHELMSGLGFPEQVQRCAGGDAGKASELAAIKRKMTAALAASDMPLVAVLSAEYSARENREAAPVRVWWEGTGRVLGELWNAGDLAARRELLCSGIGAHGYAVTVAADGTASLADVATAPDVRAWNDDRDGEVSNGQWAAAKAALDAGAA